MDGAAGAAGEDGTDGMDGATGADGATGPVGPAGADGEDGDGGAITQATESTLGGVRGASAIQAISSSGTDILGWSVNRMGQFVSVALPAMAQSDIDNSTTGRKSVTGALIAANVGGGGNGGTDDQTAAEVSVDTTNFSQNLTSTDDTVQEALETIDSFSQYQGPWQQTSWPAGVIVTRSGIAYISLVNNNTEIPTPASTQWSGLSEGYIYRGVAPVLATNYNYGQVVLEPDTGVYYYFTSTISASVARSDIATHVNFQPISGETGPAGADGSDGTDGMDGADGATGDTGPTGPTGARMAQQEWTVLMEMEQLEIPAQ